MYSATSDSAPTSLHLTHSTRAMTSENAVHLREQVRIVSDLYQQRQQHLSPPEREWIQNAISYTRQIIDPFFSTCNAPDSKDRASRRLQVLYALTSRARQPQSRATLWNSQFSIAMQNLNSAMNMLSWSAHASHSPHVQTGIYEEDLSRGPLEPELSSFLNRNRVRGGDPTMASSQNAIAELRTTNNSLRSTTRNQTLGQNPTDANELPLTLAETVELWRQNAEDALKDAMRQYFVQEEILRGRTEPLPLQANSPGDRLHGTEDSPDALVATAQVQDFSTAAGAAPTRIDTQRRSPTQRPDPSNNASAADATCRKPLPTPPPSLLPTNIAPSSPAPSTSILTPSTVSRRSITSSTTASPRGTDTTTPAPSPYLSAGLTATSTPPLTPTRVPGTPRSAVSPASPSRYAQEYLDKPLPSPLTTDDHDLRHRHQSHPATNSSGLLRDVQLEPCTPATGGGSSSSWGRKSRGRAWLERMAALDD